MGCHKDVSPTPYLHCVVLSVVGPASGFPSQGVGVGVTIGIMIQTPHSLHTHSRSSLYIYNAIQHLLQLLVVIPYPDICSLGLESNTPL